MILKVFTEEDLNPPPPTETENKELWKRAWLLQHNSNECSPGERVVKMVENDSYSQPWILNAQNGERLVNLLQQSITFVQVKEKDHPATSNNKKNNIKIFKRSIQTEHDGEEKPWVPLKRPKLMRRGTKEISEEEKGRRRKQVVVDYDMIIKSADSFSYIPRGTMPPPNNGKYTEKEEEEESEESEKEEEASESESESGESESENEESESDTESDKSEAETKEKKEEEKGKKVETKTNNNNNKQNGHSKKDNKTNTPTKKENNKTQNKNNDKKKENKTPNKNNKKDNKNNKNNNNKNNKNNEKASKLFSTPKPAPKKDPLTAPKVIKSS